MEIISVIVMFIFGNMNDTEDRLTQYVPMESLSSCMKEVRLLKRDKEFQKEALKEWTLKAKEKWESSK
jgi:hypothetical protein